MNSFEKAEKLFNCEGVPKTKQDVPIQPMMIVTQGALCPDVTQKEIIDDYKKWMHASDYFFDNYGKPDVFQSACAGDVMFALSLETRRPGYELGENELYQFVETSKMDIEDYKDIIKNGWSGWYNKYMGSIQHPKTGTFKVILKFIKMGIQSGKIHKWLKAKGIVPLQDTGSTPGFDMLSQIRSFEDFICDIYDEPELVKQASERVTQDTIKTTLQNVKKNVGRIAIYPMRSSAGAISPDIFKEFSWPSMKKMIMAYHEAGYKTIVHADGNWIPMLPSFKEVPKACCHFEFDNQTDIFEAAKILDGYHSFKGNVPATMMAFGKPEEVSAYCERLINEIGLKTPGFMLGSGCEIPLNVKPENLRAFMASVK